MAWNPGTDGACPQGYGRAHPRSWSPVATYRQRESSGTTTSIKLLAETIARLIGYQGEIFWDTSKPDGQMVKIFAPDKLNQLGLACATPLETGLARTIRWFTANYATRGDGLRL